LKKLLVPVIASILILGIIGTAPNASAGASCIISQNQKVNVNFGLDDMVIIQKTLDCDDIVLGLDVDGADCQKIGVRVEFSQPVPDQFPTFTEQIFNDALDTDEGHCTVVWTIFFDQNANGMVTQELWFNEVTVGGEIIPIDTTMVLLAGTHTVSAWMIPIIVAAAGFGLLIQTQKTRLKLNSCPSCKSETDDTFQLGENLVGKCKNSKCRVSLFFARKF